MPKPAFKKGEGVFGQKKVKSDDELVKVSENSVRKPVGPPVDFVRAPKKALKIGSLILRPIHFFKNGDSVMLSPSFSEGKENNTVFRIDAAHTLFTKELVVGDPNLKGARACVCRNDVPSDWIAFKVTGFGTSGRVTFVEPVLGTKKELLKHYVFDKNTTDNLKQNHGGAG